MMKVAVIVDLSCMWLWEFRWWGCLHLLWSLSWWSMLWCRGRLGR